MMQYIISWAASLPDLSLASLYVAAGVSLCASALYMIMFPLLII